MKKKKSLSQLLKSGKTYVFPGAFNAAVALQIQQAGYPGVYASGAGIVNGLAGLPDLELLSREEMVWAMKYITRIVQVPVICDADTGFGGPAQVAKTVKQFETIGASAIHLEDQKSPKRCGHLKGKELVSTHQMCEKIKAAVKARKNKNFMIIARTDARSVEGIASAITRSEAYIAAGADALFPEALQSIEEFKRFRSQIKAPLIANMTEFGKTPYISIRQFEKLRYNIVLFPLSAFRLSMKQTESFLKALPKKGSQKSFLKQMQTRKELYRLVQYQKYNR